jgi:hypothetical protein
MASRFPTLPEIKKALAGFAAAVVFAVGQGLVSGAVAHWVLGAVGAVGVLIAVYVPENAPAPASARNDPIDLSLVDHVDLDAPPAQEVVTPDEVHSPTALAGLGTVAPDASTPGQHEVIEPPA